MTDASDVSVKRRNGKNNWYELGKAVLWLVVLLQVVIMAWFSGAITRREQSLYVWDGYVDHLHRFGTADAIFGSALYLLYYAFIVELAYVLLSGLLKPDQPMDEAGTRNHRVAVMYCSLWVLFTFLTFGDSIFQFIRSLPTFDWLIILWGCSTFVAVSVFWRLFEQKRYERNERLEQRINER